MTSYTALPATRIEGELIPPGDKSISHRAIMLAAVASGSSSFTHLLEAADCFRTMEAFRAMGVAIEKQGDGGAWTVQGKGLDGLNPPANELYMGNSGTSMRLLLGVLASRPFHARLTGDASLSARPMKRVTNPLRKMGARITGRDDGNFAPLEIEGGKLRGIYHQNEPASAQAKSAVLLAGLSADGKTTVEEKVGSRDHTEHMLCMMGADLTCEPGRVTVQRTDHLNSIQYRIPGDISSAAFFMVAAAILPGSDLFIQEVGLNPTRTGILEILKAMGADVSWDVIPGESKWEPVGNVHIRGSRLHSVVIGGDMIPKLIDELPILMIACAAAEGVSEIRDAKELRVKETDRIESMAEGLRAIGGFAEEREDGCVIQGTSHFRGGRVLSFGDHRTAMSFSVAALKSENPVVIDDVECINTSYPAFFEDLDRFSVRC